MARIRTNKGTAFDLAMNGGGGAILPGDIVSGDVAAPPAAALTLIADDAIAALDALFIMHPYYVGTDANGVVSVTDALGSSAQLVQTTDTRKMTFDSTSQKIYGVTGDCLNYNATLLSVLSGVDDISMFCVGEQPQVNNQSYNEIVGPATSYELFVDREESSGQKYFSRSKRDTGVAQIIDGTFPMGTNADVSYIAFASERGGNATVRVDGTTVTFATVEDIVTPTWATGWLNSRVNAGFTGTCDFYIVGFAASAICDSDYANINAALKTYLDAQGISHDLA